MPAKSKENKRIKPVIEEVVEEVPQEVPSEPTNVEPVIDEVPSESPAVESAVNEEIEDAQTEPVPEPKKIQRKTNLKLIFSITVISALVAAVVSGGVYVYLSGLDERNTQQSQEDPTPEPIVLPTESPSPTPEPNVDVSEFSVSILNGSGKIGAAGDAEEVVTAAGFSVGNTGNAGKYDYENTVIQAKSSVDASVIDKLQEALSYAEYKAEIGDTLTTGNYDIVVIVGAN